MFEMFLTHVKEMQTVFFPSSYSKERKDFNQLYKPISRSSCLTESYSSNLSGVQHTVNKVHLSQASNLNCLIVMYVIAHEAQQTRIDKINKTVV